MKDPNPYAPPSANDGHDSATAQLQRVSLEFRKLRAKPPTIVNMLSRKSGPAFALTIGFVVVAILLLLLPPSTFRQQVAIGFSAFVFGVIARDWAHIRTFVRWWPINAHFIDWDKVDEFKG